MNRADWILALAIVVLALLVGPAVHAASAVAPASIVTITGPSGTSEVPLAADAELHVAGLDGEVVVVIEHGAAHVEDSSCPDRVCVRSGAISGSGEAIVCIPNGVTVRIGGERSDGLDAVVR